MGQRQLDIGQLHTIHRQIEPHPALAVTLEQMDISGTQRRAVSAGIDLGRQDNAQLGNEYLLMQAVDNPGGGLGRGNGRCRQQRRQAEQGQKQAKVSQIHQQHLLTRGPPPTRD